MPLMKTSKTTCGVNYKFSLTAPMYNVQITSMYIMVYMYMYQENLIPRDIGTYDLLVKLSHSVLSAPLTYKV